MSLSNQRSQAGAFYKRLAMLSLIWVALLVFDHAHASEPQVRSLDLKLDEGQLLSLIAPKLLTTPEAKDALKVYYAKAINLAQKHGYQNHGPLIVKEAVVGDDQKKAFALATWPSVEAMETFEGLQEWKPYREMRPSIWAFLKFYRASVENAKLLSFREDKLYTIALMRFSSDESGPNQAYFGGIKEIVESSGGRTIHSMHKVAYDSHNGSLGGPDEINIVEWDSEATLTKLTTSKAFKQNVARVNSAAAEFEFYRVVPKLK